MTEHAKPVLVIHPALRLSDSQETELRNAGYILLIGQEEWVKVIYPNRQEMPDYVKGQVCFARTQGVEFMDKESMRAALLWFADRETENLAALTTPATTRHE